jgi:hypothetical protein
MQLEPAHQPVRPRVHGASEGSVHVARASVAARERLAGRRLHGASSREGGRDRHGADVFHVDLAGDDLVAQGRDDRRDQREPVLALVGDQDSQMLGLGSSSASSRLTESGPVKAMAGSFDFTAARC